jgi:hypothetical protein
MAVGKAIQVLYIGGSGRSGSTLFERMLACHERLVSVGELSYIWERGLTDSYLCGCGERFRECPFWMAVLEQAFGGVEAIDIGEMRGLKHAVDRPRYLPYLLSGWKPAAYRRRLDVYRGALAKLYAGIQAVSGADVIIDSSKEVSTAAILHTLPAVRLHLAHMMRDSRAVAFSHAKARLRQDVPEGVEAYQVRWRPARSALIWSYRNVGLEVLRAVSGTRRGEGVRGAMGYTRIRYEDFVQHPAATLASVFDALGVAAPGAPIVRDGEVHLGEDHTISGSPVRLKRGVVALRPDMTWRQGMRTCDRRLVSALTLPLLWRYGYRVCVRDER